ncbi:hypothetical protein MCJ35_24535 [Enterocloster sp. OA13]|uniref:DUF7768 domain-containing protein n=1 Tax=Enterocloster sp. OA13 TaxID=2914161 RepID=UPI000472521A|nr:hypothetical protein [Enterocloster sp. OA13]
MLKNKTYYICSPLYAPTHDGIRKNMLMARYYMKRISGEYGCRAVAPHAYLPELLDDTIQRERELGIAFGMVLLGWCDGVIICGDIISSGMAAEIKEAEKLNLPLYHLKETPGAVYLTAYGKEQDSFYEMQI